jgi:hypothetical protein
MAQPIWSRRTNSLVVLLFALTAAALFAGTNHIEAANGTLSVEVSPKERGGYGYQFLGGHGLSLWAYLVRSEEGWPKRAYLIGSISIPGEPPNEIHLVKRELPEGTYTIQLVRATGSPAQPLTMTTCGQQVHIVPGEGTIVHFPPQPGCGIPDWDQVDSGSRAAQSAFVNPHDYWPALARSMANMHSKCSVLSKPLFDLRRQVLASPPDFPTLVPNSEDLLSQVSSGANIRSYLLELDAKQVRLIVDAVKWRCGDSVYEPPKQWPAPDTLEERHLAENLRKLFDIEMRYLSQLDDIARILDDVAQR